MERCAAVRYRFPITDNMGEAKRIIARRANIMRKLEFGALGFSILLLFVVGYCLGKSLCIGPVGEQYRLAGLAAAALQFFVTVGLFIALGKEEL